MVKGVKGLAGKVAGKVAGALHTQADKLEAWAGIKDAHGTGSELESELGVESGVGIESGFEGVKLDVEEYRRATLTGVSAPVGAGIPGAPVNHTELRVPPTSVAKAEDSVEVIAESQGTAEQGTADKVSAETSAEASAELTYDEDSAPVSADNTRFSDSQGTAIPGVYVYNGD